MLNRRLLLLLSLVVLVGAFGYGLMQLFQLRFAAGDVYPPYSTLRGDPLGSRVYYESLEQAGGVRVRRHIESIDKLPEGRGVTLFVIGLPWSEMSAEPDEYKALERFVRNGGRLVLTLYPELARPKNNFGLGTNRAGLKNPLGGDDPFAKPSVRLSDAWGFNYGFVSTDRKEFVFQPTIVTHILPSSLPGQLSWHSGLIFINLDFNWRVIYARGTDPVLIERPLGRGTIVLATDSFFLSNEALRNERAADLLAWLAGDSSEIVFNETHLGVQQQPGVATLAHRYKLHGGALALLALAALFVWKSSASFVPRPADAGTAAPVRGRESAAGFENLLRRSVPPKDLLQTSLDEWHKAGSLDARSTPAHREKIRAIIEACNATEKPDVVESYREIARILNRRK